LEPSRFRISLIFKQIIDKILNRFPFFKRFNKNNISGLSLVCSLVFYLLISRRMMIWCIAVLILVLFLDVLDGSVARVKGQASSEEGWIVDVSVDRISEALVSLALSRVYILLVISNIGLVFYSYKNQKHVILPLRQLLLLILLVYLFTESEPITLLLDAILFNM
jgi:hypothetical protein